MAQTPWVLRPTRLIDVAERAAKQAKINSDMLRARNEAGYDKPKPKKSLVGRALKATSGFIPDPVEDVVKSTGTGALKGLDTWGNQVASVPAALFTQGQVQDGQYTTKRNLIGNPLANVASHVKAQREAGIDTGTGLRAGFAAARRAGQAFNEDPDISPGVKTAAGIAFDPSTFVAAGALSKIPKIAAIGGAKGALLRAPLSIAEGVSSPKQALALAAGAGLGTEAASRVNIPGVSEGVEQFTGGFLGGGLGIKGITREPINSLTTVVKDTERLHHGTPHIIRKGEIVTSPKGDIGPGHYTALEGEYSGQYVEGDPANVTGFVPDYTEGIRKKLETEGGQQIYRYRPIRDLFMLEWGQPIDNVEASRINNVFKKRGLETRVQEGMTGEAVLNLKGIGEAPNIIGVLNEAGWDGMTNGSQYTVWRPNEVLESDLTPPASEVKTPAKTNPVHNKTMLTASQLGEKTKLVSEHPEWESSKIHNYFLNHTDSYGDKLLGHPTIQEYIGQTDSDANFKWDEPGVVVNTKDITSIKSAGGIPDSDQTVQNFLEDLKKNGHLVDAVSGESPDFSQMTFTGSLWNKLEIALDKADSNGWLSETGKKQFSDVLKKMDELEPLKGVQAKYGAIKPKQTANEGVEYTYDPITGKAIIEQVAEPQYFIHQEDGSYFWQNKDTGEAFESTELENLIETINGSIGEYKPSPNIAKAIQPEQEVMLSTKQLSLKTHLKNMYPHIPDDVVHKYVQAKFDTAGHVLSDTEDLLTFAKKEIGPAASQNITPVDPDEIAGIKPVKGPEDYIKEVEQGLGKPYEFKDYAAPGQEGAPIAGAPKSKGSTTPYKNPITKTWELHDSNNHILMESEDLGDLIDEATKAGYKVLPPEGLSGGALPEALVTPKEIQVGLTKGEKIGNAFTKVKRFILDHGVENDAIATPIAKEYLRINNVLKTQAVNIGKLAMRFEKFANIDDALQVDMSTLSPEARKVAERLQYAMDAYEETLKQFDTEFKDIQEFFDSVRNEQGYENKKYSDIVTEYGNAIANKVSDKWLQGQIKGLGESIDISAEEGISIPGRTVNIVGAGDIKLPKDIADVINNAVRKVHPPKSPESYELFQAVNNTLRGMWAAADNSRLFIQQLPMWADNPKRAAQSYIASWKAMKDPSVMADFITRHDEARFGTNKPTVTEYIRTGLHQAQATGEGTDIGGLPGKVQNVRGIGNVLKKTNILFTEGGNLDRISIADMLWDQYESGGASMLTGLYTKAGKRVTDASTRTEVLEAIARAANRSTGYAEKGFGGPLGSALFFAPRFMQSQLETVMKAAWGGGIESQVARRQLLKIIAIGSGITIAANEARGEDTIFDPRDSNFMRIRNVGGADLSLFGPWDTLVKGVIRSVPHPDASGDWTLGEPQYLLRSKLSPVLSTTVDFIAGENVVGQSSRDWSVVGNLLLPFSIRKIGTEPVSSTAFGFVGGKGTPLSDTEVLDNKLANAGIKKSDPDYLIKRKEYLAAHPDAVPEAESGSFKRSQEVQRDIAARRKANDDLTKASGQTLVEFREKRKLILTEQRNRLDEVIKSDSKKATTQQRKWLNSYFTIFDNEANLDPITKEVNPDKFDAAVAEWTNKNGSEALNFVQRYMGAGLNEVERAYYNDLRKLEAVGYFDTPKYQKMKSGLTEDEIDALAAQVDSFRVANPKLASQPWATTAKKVLGESLDSTELLDILHSRKEAYANPAREKLKQQYGKEVLWFNSRADWNAYTTYTPGKKSSASTPKIGGALKTSLKPKLK